MPGARGPGCGARWALASAPWALSVAAGGAGGTSGWAPAAPLVEGRELQRTPPVGRPPATPDDPGRPCGSSDLFFGFTVCWEDADGGMSRNLFAFPPPASRCNSSHPLASPLPPPRVGLPCHHPCGVGQHQTTSLARNPVRVRDTWQTLLEVGCEECQPGKFSLGGTLVDGSEGDWTSLWPENLRTMCFYHGSDLQWHAGDEPDARCMLHFGGLQAETRAARWNEALPDEALSLPLAAAPGGNEELCVPLGPGEAAALKDRAVLVRRGNCTFQQKAEAVFGAGGRAVVVYNNVAQDGFVIPVAADETHPPQIPLVFITLEDGRRWAARLAELRGDASAALLRVPSPRCSEAAREVVDTAAGDDAVGSFYDAGRLGCDVWRVDGAGRFLFSGDNSRFHWIYVILEMSLDFLRDGHVLFRYSVDSEEGYDGLVFEIDEAVRLPMVSLAAEYAEFYAEVPRGPHTFTWTYKKDYSGSSGEDVAKLELLEIAGTTYADAECRSCRGRARSRGGRCAVCPLDTYLQEGPGGTPGQCVKCPRGTWSAPGSEGAGSCRPRRACTEWDVDRTPSSVDERGAPTCDGGTTLATYRLRDPTTCDVALGGAPLKRGEVVEPCPPCPGHAERPAEGGACEPVTRHCGGGLHAMRELLIDRWLDWPVGFRTEVVSASANRTALGSGWRRSPTGDAAVIGSAYGGDALEGWGAEASLLHLEALLDSPGELTFSVEASPDSAWGLQASVLANGTAPWGLRLVAEEGGRRTLRAPLSAGAVRLTWVWRHAADVEGTGAGLAVSGIKLLNVSVTHVQGAGVRGCEPCPAGSAAGEGDGGLLCRPCPAGTTSDGAGSACAPCPPGTAARSGEGSCRPCGGGLRSGAGAAHCEPEGTLQKDARQWNGSALVGAWRRAAGASASALVRVEDQLYFLSLFGPASPPGRVSEDTLAYWWAWWPPSNSTMDVGTTATLSVDAGCGAGSGDFFDSVGETLEALEPFADEEAAPETALGVRATFSGTCDFGLPRAVHVVFRCDGAALETGNLLSAVAAELAGGASQASEPLEMSFVDGRRPLGPESCEEVSLEWRTPAACPLCPEGGADFVPVADSRCEDGVRTMRYRARTPCFGGAPAPAPYLVECGGIPVRLLALAVAAPSAVAVCLACCYLARVRRKYARYMALQEPEQPNTNAAPATSIGVSEDWK